MQRSKFKTMASLYSILSTVGTCLAYSLLRTAHRILQWLNTGGTEKLMFRFGNQNQTLTFQCHPLNTSYSTTFTCLHIIIFFQPPFTLLLLQLIEGVSLNGWESCLESPLLDLKVGLLVHLNLPYCLYTWPVALHYRQHL